MKPRDYILMMLQREYSFKEGIDIDSIDYIAEGYMDSMGTLQFIVDLEAEYQIQFTDEELASSEFRIVGKLIRLVEKKARVTHG
ncbi:acyl carrier protein [Ruminococcus gauvreauii]|uniref:acyl carrier protein n=1 Tax=Ruminococcus gauvreauii TaxID=438033 RepID=UPI00398425B5